MMNRRGFKIKHLLGIDSAPKSRTVDFFAGPRLNDGMICPEVNKRPNYLRELSPADRCIEAEDLPTPIDWPRLFGLDQDARPRLELEVGCGNGRFLRRAAEAHPDRLFFGIEKTPKYARLANERMQKYEVGNVRIAHADATRVIADKIANGSVDAFHCYFTDPWPKRKHAKRRLFQTPFLEQMHRILVPDAPVFIKVDLFWYFTEILMRFEASRHFTVTANGVESDVERGHYEITGFEQKALAKKGRTFFIEARRLP